MLHKKLIDRKYGHSIFEAAFLLWLIENMLVTQQKCCSCLVKCSSPQMKLPLQSCDVHIQN